MKKTSVRMVPESHVADYLRDGWMNTGDMQHGDQIFYIMKRNRDGTEYTGRKKYWSQYQEEAYKRMKPEVTYFDDDLFSM